MPGKGLRRGGGRHTDPRGVLQDSGHGVTDGPDASRRLFGGLVVAGGDDFLVHVALPSVDALHAFLMDKLSKRREIVSFRSSVVYQHSRNQVIAPLL